MNVNPKGETKIMKKIDYKKELKQFYNASAKNVEIVDVPQMNFLMIDGEGDPNTSQAFQDAVEALFSVSYTLKFMAVAVEVPEGLLWFWIGSNCLFVKQQSPSILSIPFE
jgi:hypothetical protein